MTIRTRAVAAALAFGLGMWGCGGGDDDGSGDTDSGPDSSGTGSSGMRGDPCTIDGDCATGLACRGGTCDFAGTLGAGAPCDYTAECMDGLYCSAARICEAAGTGGDGDSCGSTADCLRFYVCVPEPGGSVCRLAEGRDVGQNCIRAEQCIAGLFCVGSTCSLTPGGGPMEDGGTPGEDGGGSGWDSGPPRGCTTRSDCDDGSMCTIEQCIADICNYTLLDSDEDGYASTIIPGGCGRDCADDDPVVNPDHTDFHGERHRGNPPLEAGTFDWNCDGVQELRYTAVLPECNPDTGACPEGTEGWVGAPPMCGQGGTWARCTSCRVETVEASRQQTCR